MRAAVLVATGAAAAVMLLPSSAVSGRQKPYVLTALADIGTVYWRYDCVHYRANEWSLGVRIFRDTATTGVTYRAGGFTRRRTLQPGDQTTWFPFRREHRQTLSLVQATEPGTLRGHVLARFKGRECQAYFTPRLSVEIYPR